MFQVAARKDDSAISAYEQARCNFDKDKAESDYMKSNSCVTVSTLSTILNLYSGTTIPQRELDFQVQIGRGGYGEVFFCKWNGTVVAVKKVRRDKSSNKYLSKQAEELIKCWQLSHPNIVRFIGACTDVDCLSIVMEYMSMSLHDALHIKNKEFSDKDLLKIIVGICEGLWYMHMEKNMAHCDLKPQNILLDLKDGQPCHAKISDFGLSMSTTPSFTVRRAGTPRYSAPEVTKGRALTGKQMMKCDIYSLDLVMYEAIFREEPYFNTRRSQLRDKVCSEDNVMQIPDAVKIDPSIETIMEKAWRYKPTERPEITDVKEVFKRVRKIRI